MYKNIICFFSFPLLPKMYVWIEWEKVQDSWAAHTKIKVGILGKTSSLPMVSLKHSWLYNIPDANINSHCRISFSLHSTHSTWTCLLLPCYQHNTCDHASFQQATHTISAHFCWEHLHPVYYRYQVHFLLFLFPVSDFYSCINRCQRESSSQYPTSFFLIIY